MDIILELLFWVSLGGLAGKAITSLLRWSETTDDPKLNVQLIIAKRSNSGTLLFLISYSLSMVLFLVPETRWIGFMWSVYWGLYILDLRSALKKLKLCK